MLKKRWLGIVASGLFLLTVPMVSMAMEKKVKYDAPPVDETHGASDGYKIYMSYTPGIDPTNVTTYFQVVDVGNVLEYIKFACHQHIYFVVTAYNEGGESPPSNEIDWIYPICIPHPPLIQWGLGIGGR